jgi:D-alanine-D-alanine ligase
MRVALLANLKVNAPKIEELPPDYWDDLDSEHTIEAILEALRAGGHTAEFFEGNLSLVDQLPRWQPDICFNICEGHVGDSREAHIPAILEMLRLPYTASPLMTLALTLDKPMTKRVLTFQDLPTPGFQVFERANEPLSVEMQFPLFVKPSREGTGTGITTDSIVNDEAALRAQLESQLKQYQQPILVERFIQGRDVTVGVVGNLTSPAARRMPYDTRAPRVTRGLLFLPVLEVDMSQYDAAEGGIYSNRLKVALADDFHYFCPAPLSEEQVRELNFLAAAVFRVTGCTDVARVDFRLDANDNDRPTILEINPLPGLSPGISDLVLEAEAAGIGYTELINMILDEAIDRYEL